MRLSRPILYALFWWLSVYSVCLCVCVTRLVTRLYTRPVTLVRWTWFAFYSTTAPASTPPQMSVTQRR